MYVPDFGKIELKIGGGGVSWSIFHVFSLLKIANLPELLMSLLTSTGKKEKF